MKRIAISFLTLVLATRSAAGLPEKGRPPAGAHNATAFDRVVGWNMLRWQMKLPEARRALQGASISFKERFMHKDGTTHLIWHRENWEGVVYFDQQGVMVQILFQSPHLESLEAAEKVLRGMRSQFGMTHNIAFFDYRDSNRSDVVHYWFNHSTTLSITIAHYLQRKEWVVWEAYVPADKLARERIPVCRTLRELETHDGRAIRLVGDYRIQDIAPYKMVKELPDGKILTSSRIVGLTLSDGTWVDLGIRSEDEMKVFAGTRVAVAGKIVVHPPRLPEYVSQPDPVPTLMAIQEVMALTE